MRRFSIRLTLSKVAYPIAALLLIGAGLLILFPANGAQLFQRSLMLSNNQPGANSIYKVSFTINTPSTLGSIEMLFCSNSPINGDACQAPIGLDVSNAVIASQVGETGFSISSDTYANNLILTRTPTSSLAIPVSYDFDNVTNPSTNGSYYLRIYTYDSPTPSPPATAIDFGGLAFSINSAVNISTYVPPFIRVCVGVTISGYNCNTANGDYIDMGTLTSTRTSAATNQIVVATNASNGYNLSVSGDTLASGNNILPPLNGDISRPGVSQFGINLTANVAPSIGSNVQGPGVGIVSSAYNQPNFFRYASGDVIAHASAPADNNKYTISYILNSSKDQPSGVYVTTLTYVGTGSF